MYDLEINGTRINVDEDTTLEGLMNAINSNADAGVKVSYSKLTNEFKFTATETGANSKIEFGGLAKGLFVNHDALEGDGLVVLAVLGRLGLELALDVDGQPVNVKAVGGAGEILKALAVDFHVHNGHRRGGRGLFRE